METSANSGISAATWQSAQREPLAKRPLGEALWRGFRGRCPNCGEGKLFRAFLKVNDRCPHCNEELFHHRADDAPPYITMVIVGHILVPVILAVQTAVNLPTEVHLAIWLPVTLIMTLVLLQPVKGAVVGLQWALRMHGFDGKGDHSDQPAIVWPGLAKDSSP